MLANRMTVPRRARLEGRGGWNLRAVGKDQDPLSMADINAMVFDTQQQAILCYEYVLRSVAVRTKIAFLADLLSKIQANPQLYPMFTTSPDGQNYLGALQAASDAFMTLTLPNAFQNLQLIRNQMEVNILPKTYNLGVQARLPAYQSGMADLSYSDVVIQMPSMFDYGDLTKTTIKDDLQRMQELSSQIDPSIRLSGAPLIIGIIIVGVWGALALVWGIVSAWNAPKQAIVDLLNQAKANGVDFNTISDILKRVETGDTLLTQATNFLKWGAIGLGILVAGGAAWHYFG